MKPAKLLLLTAMTLGSFGAFGAAAAPAASPAVLCLVSGCQNIEAAMKGTTVITETLKGKRITSSTTEAKVKNCEALAGTEEKDVSLCKDVTLSLTGVGAEGVKCKSEGDEPGVVLTLIDLHLASAESSGKALEPLGLGKVLNSKLEAAEVIVTCGVLKMSAKGTFACSTPVGLKNISTSEELILSCHMKAGDQEVGTCVSLCEWLKTDPFLINLGSGFEDAAKEFTVSGKPTKDIFVDD